MASTNVASSFRHAYLVETLEPFILRHDTPEQWALLLEDPLTPQARALQWMSEVDFFSAEPETLEDKILLERYVLAVLYFSTSGPDWHPYFADDLAWNFTEFPYLNTTLSVCDWNKESGMEFSFYDSLFSNANGIGILCTPPSTTDNGSTGLVSSVSLNLLNLVGTVPWEISLLENLSHLSMYMNGIIGTLPTELGELVQLQDLLVHSNSDLSGTIPTEVGKLSQLTELAIYGTSIGGSIPTEFGNLQQLLSLGLWSTNPLTGTIPTEMGSMSRLMEISISGQQLSGIIPSEMANLSNLKSLMLYDIPSLTGTLPTELEVLELDVFSLRNTSVTGSLDVLCPLVWNEFVLLQADCLEDVECSCCDICCDDTGYCEMYNKSDSSFWSPDYSDDNEENIMDGGFVIRLDTPVMIISLLMMFSFCSFGW